MNEFDGSMPRRAFLKAPVSASAPACCPASCTPAQRRRPSGEIWSKDYWAKKGDVKLNLWRKRVGAPRRAKPARPVVFLVHGSSNSSRSSYDLDSARQGRIFADERAGARRLRRLDHGP